MSRAKSLLSWFDRVRTSREDPMLCRFDTLRGVQANPSDPTVPVFFVRRRVRAA
jgi:hypothetical protein